MSNQEKYNTLRKAYPEFVYETYHYNVQPDGLHIVFSFSIGEHRFQPCSFIPARTFRPPVRPAPRDDGRPRLQHRDD